MRREARNCEVGLNTLECEAPADTSQSTRSSCFRCGKAACKACSEKRTNIYAVGPRRIRICNDCVEEENKDTKMKASKKPPPKLLTKEDAAELAEAIRRIDTAVKQVGQAGLNRRALVVLLHDMSGVAKTEINKVLDGLEDLGKYYLKKA